MIKDPAQRQQLLDACAEYEEMTMGNEGEGVAVSACAAAHAVATAAEAAAEEDSDGGFVDDEAGREDNANVGN